MSGYKLREKIKRKFKTISNFVRKTGISRYDLELASRHPRSKSSKRIAKFLAEEDPNGVGGHIDPKRLELLKTKINEFGGVLVFCEYVTYKDDEIEGLKYSSRSVYQILDGRRKRMSKVVQALFDHFGI